MEVMIDIIGDPEHILRYRNFIQKESINYFVEKNRYEVSSGLIIVQFLPQKSDDESIIFKNLE